MSEKRVTYFMCMSEVNEIYTGMFVVAFLFICVFLNHTTRYENPLPQRNN